VVGRKVTKARLLGDIYEAVCTSAALPVPLDAPAIAMFRLVLAEARGLIRQRDVIEAQADELLRTHPDYLHLRQVPGIGPFMWGIKIGPLVKVERPICKQLGSSFAGTNGYGQDGRFRPFVARNRTGLCADGSAL
jgi:hypothetical protein